MIVSPFVHTFDIIFLFAAELEEPRIGICGKGLKFLDSHISVVVYSFLEFWKVSKWCNREWVKFLPNTWLFSKQEEKWNFLPTKNMFMSQMM